MFVVVKLATLMCSALFCSGSHRNLINNLRGFINLEYNERETYFFVLTVFLQQI